MSPEPRRARNVLAFGLAAWLAAAAIALARQDPPAPDPVYFEERIQPILIDTCSTTGCHGEPGAGRLILEKPDFTGRLDADASQRNLETALQFVVPGDPMQSRLLLKPLARRDGGLPHAGAHYDVRKGSDLFREFSDWISGVQLLDVPPIADAGTDVAAKVGQRVVLDGAASRERRGGALSYSWRIESWPDGAVPSLKGADTARPTFRAHEPGAYTLSLVVGNGLLESAPDSVTVELDDRPFVLLDATAFTEARGFVAVKDPAAAGGRALAPGQEARPEAPARATFELRVPEAGPYRLYARARARADRELPLAVAIDGAEPLTLVHRGTSGYAFVPVGEGDVADAAEEAYGAALPGARGFVQGGSAVIAGGALELDGTAARPARFRFDDRVPEGGIRARIALDAADGAATARALVLFDVLDGENARFAGIERDGDGTRWIVGRIIQDATEVLARRDVIAPPDAPDAPDAPAFDLALEFDRASASLSFGDGAEPLRADFGGRATGIATAATGAPGRAGLLAIGRARFDDVTLEGSAADPVRLGFDVAATPRGHLAAGDHVLELSAADPEAPCVDDLVLVRADLAAAAPAEHRRMVRALHLDVLGRPPLPVEQLTSAGLDRRELARRLVGSLEAYAHWYEEELYHFLLLDNFRPRTPSLEALPARLANGAATAKDALQEIVISQAFNLRNPGNDTFVTVVLEQLLGVRVQDEPRLLDAGKEMYDGRRATLFGEPGANQADVVRIVLAQDTFAARFLERQYERIFHDTPAEPDLERWSAAFRADPRAYESILLEWLGSDAYGARLIAPRPRTDAMFIQSAFVDLLGRAPSYAEFRNFRNALQALADSTPLRAVLARVLIDSGQVDVPRPVEDVAAAAPLVRDLFVRLLAREPSREELDAFGRTFASGAGGPRLVLLAIVTSAEYQTY